MMLFVCFGGGYGIFNVISTFLEQIVCPNGYDDVSVTNHYAIYRKICNLDLVIYKGKKKKSHVTSDLKIQCRKSFFLLFRLTPCWGSYVVVLELKINHWAQSGSLQAVTSL